jgi:hypothetical protein
MAETARVNYDLTATDLAGIRRVAPAQNSNAGQQIPMGRQGFIPKPVEPLPNYTPIKLDNYEAPVSPKVPWAIQEGANQIRSNILPALADRTKRLFGFIQTPAEAAAPVAQSSTGFNPIQTRSTPDVTLSTTPSPAATADQLVAATPLPKGFGTQRQMDVISPTTTAAQPAVTQAQNSFDTDTREAFGRNVESERIKAAGFKATQDRIALLNDTITANQGNQFNGGERIAAARSELASITGQQEIAQKARNTEAGLEAENIRGGFRLKEQELQNQGTAQAETIRGGFSKQATALDPSQVDENKARALLLTKQAEGTLSKKEQLELTAANKQAEIVQNQKKIGADAYTKVFAETGDAMKAADAQMAAEAALSGDQFIPGTQAQKGTFRFGFGKPEIKATSGKVVKKAPAGYTPTGETKNGKPVYVDAKGTKFVGA